MRLFAPRAALALLLPLLAIGPEAAAQTTRADVQHLLRRFAFSASPETTKMVLAEGIPAWLAAQENPGSLDDPNSQLEFPPTTLNANGNYDDYGVFERGVMQHMLLTTRQLQAKMELQWLDHFAVSANKVNDPALIYHYDATIRALALGNFTTLLTAIAKEPAMLIWLDNNNNAGPVANENFGRECMQLYDMGTEMLNMDGSPVLDPNNIPVPAYTQADVQYVAKAMTGYTVYYDYTNPNPETRFSTQFIPANHYPGMIRFLGKMQKIPQDSTAMDATIAILTHQPSVAPFMARELLQRFVTETPSPQYIADIAAVWQAQQDAPDQIAQVITAIINHPLFNAAYHALPKQPIEMVFGAMHQLPGALQGSPLVTPASSFTWQLASLGQEPFYPPSVFSFYYPGHLNSLTNTGTVLSRTYVFGAIADGDPTSQYTDHYIDFPTLRARIGNTSGRAVAKYLADALLDGASPTIYATLARFLGDTPSDDRIRGAIWLLLNTPDYTVN